MIVCEEDFLSSILNQSQAGRLVKPDFKQKKINYVCGSRYIKLNSFLFFVYCQNILCRKVRSMLM